MIWDAGQSMELSRIVPLALTLVELSTPLSPATPTPGKPLCLEAQEKPKHTDGPSAYDMIN
jgi:hypothetical protein